ncbi:ROK family protein [Hydrogenoanaerobacterium sp.]|uniref:ROK family protein n=1 Tax=Hydrogenoanaerobacterium sp. TaxID=2953763 RepID=UPI00289B667D|nr:ROK family protein [Hydrogenoanaerobacterium sp.]
MSKIHSVVDIRKNHIKYIIDYLRGKDGVTKKQISADLNLSFATVSNLCNLLYDIGIITEVSEEDTGSVGRTPKWISLKLDTYYIVAIDAHSAGVIELNLCDLCGSAVCSTRVYYDINGSLEACLDALAQSYNRFLTNAQKEAVIGIGVAVSGIYDLVTGKIVASELSLYEGQPLRLMLEERLSKPVFIENESTLCAICLAEKRKLQNILYFYLGEGVGIGIISEGNNIIGRRGYSTEISHAPLGRLARSCAVCGNKRCFQTDLSVYGFAEKFDGTEPSIGNLAAWRQFLAALEAGDHNALAATTENAEVLGEAVSIMVNLFDPEAVVIGGINQTLYETMLPVIRSINNSRRAVKAAIEPEFLLDENSNRTIIEGAAQMVYAQWHPPLSP